MRIPFVLLCLSLFTLSLSAQAYNIEVSLENFDNDTLYLGNYYGDKQYLKDTAFINDQGKFVFEGETPLEHGMYLIVLPPKNDIYEIIIEDDQDFSIEVDHALGIKSMKIKGDKQNSEFLEYIALVRRVKPKGEELSQKLQNAEEGSEERKKYQKDLENLGKEVDEFKASIISKYENNVLGLVLKSSNSVDVPDFADIKDPEEQRRAKYIYFKKHYFDDYDLSDERLLRMPFFDGKVDYYLEKLTPQSPDSINATLDYLLSGFEQNEDMFKYYLIKYLNKYAASKVVGFDAMYVHLVKNYYAKGKAPWMDQEQLDKIVKNANTLDPLLIGKVAPNVTLLTPEGKPFNLHDVKARFTILYFWEYECGHCKKSIPKLISFYEEYQAKGVEIVAVCTRLTDKVPKCWEATEERGMNIWINAADPYLRSRYKQIYDVRSTPLIYIIDKDKKIISKKIASSQLAEVIDKLIEFEDREANN